MQELLIRPASDCDAGEIMTLQRAAWITEAQLHDSPFLPPLTQTLESVRNDILDQTVLVGHLGARLVATARAFPDATTWQIGRLGVAPDLQGRGLGARLLSAIEAAAPAGITGFELFTGPKSVDNIAFYERHGYTRVPSSDGLVHLTKDVTTTEHREPRP